MYSLEIIQREESILYPLIITIATKIHICSSLSEQLFFRQNTEFLGEVRTKWTQVNLITSWPTSSLALIIYGQTTIARPHMSFLLSLSDSIVLSWSLKVPRHQIFFQVISAVISFDPKRLLRGMWNYRVMTTMSYTRIVTQWNPVSCMSLFLSQLPPKTAILVSSKL